jgi:hypothetical protein
MDASRRRSNTGALAARQKRFVFLGNEKDRGLRLWVQSVDGSNPTPISPEGIKATQWVVSPDGKLVAAVDPDHKGYLFSVDGGEPKAIPGFPDGYVPVGWTNSGHAVFIYNPGELAAKVFRLDLATNQKRLWKTLIPADAAGITGISPILVTPDGKSYVYEYIRTLCDLFLVEGIR